MPSKTLLKKTRQEKTNEQDDISTSLKENEQVPTAASDQHPYIIIQISSDQTIDSKGGNSLFQTESQQVLNAKDLNADSLI